MHATVDVQRLSRDVADTRAAQKTDGGGNLLGAAEATQQRAADQVVLWQGQIWIALGIDQAGNDTVGRDAVAGELAREGPREPDQASLEFVTTWARCLAPA